SPEGLSVFVSYPNQASTFDDASEIYLHRFADDDVAGAISHYAVTRATVDDGFGQIASTPFTPHRPTAAIDPSAKIPKFYLKTPSPGAGSPSNGINGRVENRYLNGIEQVTADNYWDMLDGLLASQAIYAQGGKTPVYQTTTSWQVFDEIASDPKDSGLRIP